MERLLINFYTIYTCNLYQYWDAFSLVGPGAQITIHACASLVQPGAHSIHLPGPIFRAPVIILVVILPAPCLSQWYCRSRGWWHSGLWCLSAVCESTASRHGNIDGNCNITGRGRLQPPGVQLLRQGEGLAVATAGTFRRGGCRCGAGALRGGHRTWRDVDLSADSGGLKMSWRQTGLGNVQDAKELMEFHLQFATRP